MGQIIDFAINIVGVGNIVSVGALVLVLAIYFARMTRVCTLKSVTLFAIPLFGGPLAVFSFLSLVFYHAPSSFPGPHVFNVPLPAMVLTLVAAIGAGIFVEDLEPKTRAAGIRAVTS